MSRMRWVILALACTAAGCPAGGDMTTSSNDGSGSGSSSADAPCDEWKAWALRCNPDAGPDDLDYYDECRMLRWDKVKPEFTRAVARCYPTLSCDDSDDTCAAQGYAALGLTEDSIGNDRLVVDCLDTIAGCDVGGDDFCVDLAALIDAARSEVSACSSLPCGEYAACIKQIYGKTKN